MDSPLRDMEKENCCNKCDDKGEPGYTECRVCPCHSLQKESEWEKSFEEKFPELWGSNDGREGYDSDVKSDVKSFIEETLSTREKEIAEEVERLPEMKGNHSEHEAYLIDRADVLQILKH